MWQYNEEKYSIYDWDLSNQQLERLTKKGLKKAKEKLLNEYLHKIVDTNYVKIFDDENNIFDAVFLKMGNKHILFEDNRSETMFIIAYSDIKNIICTENYSSIVVSDLDLVE